MRQFGLDENDTHVIFFFFFFQYSFILNVNDIISMEDDDADDGIVPRLVAKLVLPALISTIRLDYNAFSANNTQALIAQIDVSFINLIEKYLYIYTHIQCVLDHIEGFNDFAQDIVDLQREIRQHFQLITEQLTCPIFKKGQKIPQKPPNRCNDNNSPNLPNGWMYQFHKRHTWRALKLLQNIAQFNGFIASTVLDILINKYVFFVILYIFVLFMKLVCMKVIYDNLLLF